MPDLSQEEREALFNAAYRHGFGSGMPSLPSPLVDAQIVGFVRECLAAVPRLAQPEAEREGWPSLESLLAEVGRAELTKRELTASLAAEPERWTPDDFERFAKTAHAVSVACVRAQTHPDYTPAPPPTDREGAKDG